MGISGRRQLLPDHRKLQQQVALDDREIVIRHKRDNRLASRIAVHGDAFHVVDLIREIGLDYRPAIENRVRFYSGQWNAADAQRDAAGRRVAPLAWYRTSR